MNVTDVLLNIINTMWNDDACGICTEVVVIRVQFFSCIQASCALRIAQILFLLGIETDDGVACCGKPGF
ncbi:MAG: hypothetical protein AUK01_10180 [Anaerolineae bacterium CG2_30_57_67]|nr:MAG: hypothetical protein AUK01_10180 [Anaerolineae bacterium CG2_30_57_67]